MRFVEANPLPQICQECEAEKRELDCSSCEYAGYRFLTSELDELTAKKKLLLRRLSRDQERVREIEVRIAEIEKRS